MADEAPLPPLERDTLDLSLRSTPDPFLGDLIELAQHGTELALGLLVNGMVVIGRLDRPEAIAQELSTMRQRLIDFLLNSPFNAPGVSAHPNDHVG